jgi:hypothetical protein
LIDTESTISRTEARCHPIKDAYDKMTALGAAFDYDFGKEAICRTCVDEEYLRMCAMAYYTIPD